MPDVFIDLFLLILGYQQAFTCTDSGLDFLPNSQEHITFSWNFICRYSTLCLMCHSPTPSCTCLGRRAVTPSPRPAVRGPWHCSTQCNQQRNVSPCCPGPRWCAGQPMLPHCLGWTLPSFHVLLAFYMLEDCVSLSPLRPHRAGSRIAKNERQVFSQGFSF
jgi:hypothetical protein